MCVCVCAGLSCADIRLASALAHASLLLTINTLSLLILTVICDNVSLDLPHYYDYITDLIVYINGTNQSSVYQPTT